MKWCSSQKIALYSSWYFANERYLMRIDARLVSLQYKICLGLQIIADYPTIKYRTLYGAMYSFTVVSPEHILIHRQSINTRRKDVYKAWTGFSRRIVKIMKRSYIISKFILWIYKRYVFSWWYKFDEDLSDCSYIWLVVADIVM